MNTQGTSTSSVGNWFFEHKTALPGYLFTIASLIFGFVQVLPWSIAGLLGILGVAIGLWTETLLHLTKVNSETRNEVKNAREENEKIRVESKKALEESREETRKALEEIRVLVRLEPGQIRCKQFDNHKEAEQAEKSLIEKMDRHLRQIVVGVGDGLSIERGKVKARRMRERKEAGAKVRYELVLQIEEFITSATINKIDSYLECFKAEGVYDLVRINILRQKSPWGHNWLFIDRHHQFCWPSSTDGDLKDMQLFEDQPHLVGPHIDWFESDVFHNPATETYDKVKQSLTSQNAPPSANV